MPYDSARDPYRLTLSPNKRGAAWSAPLTASTDDFTIYPKALTVFVPAGTAGPHLSVRARNDSDAAEAITLPEGLTLIDFVVIRAVTAITANVIVRRVDD